MLFIAFTFSSFLVLSCLSFANNSFGYYNFEKAFSVTLFSYHLLSGKIVVEPTSFQKDLILFNSLSSYLLNYLFVSSFLFGFQ